LHYLGNHTESTATWIDTTGDFSPENACELLNCSEVIQKSSLVLERLQISLAFDIDAAQALVDHAIHNIDVRAITYLSFGLIQDRVSATLPAFGHRCYYTIARPFARPNISPRPCNHD
jgi:hypothetical protein